MIRKWSTEIGVTSHRFVERYGLLSMRTNEIALPNIEGVRVNQIHPGPHLRLWHGADRRHRRGSVTTPTIADPVGFVRAIQTAREHARAALRAQRTVNRLDRFRQFPGDGRAGKVTVTRVPWPRALSIAMAPCAGPPTPWSAAGPGRCPHSGAPAGYRPGRKAGRRSPHPRRTCRCRCRPPSPHMPSPDRAGAQAKPCRPFR